MRHICRAVLASAIALLPACSADSVTVTVDVRTDYYPGVDFAQVVTSLTRPDSPLAEVREASLVVDGTEDFLASERVAEFSDAQAAQIRLRVRLVDAGGRTVAARNVDLDLTTSYAALVLITSNCAGVSCPGAAGNPALSECLDAQCVDPACSEAAPELCPEPCVRDADCAPDPDCTTRQCIIGTCFCADDLTRPPPDSGVPDTGPACECTPDQTEDQPATTCGRCGSGTRTDRRTCGADCRWGPVVMGTCDGVMGCVPGNETACANGDSCGRRICRSDCTFGPCVPIAGGQCLRIGPGSTVEGSNYRCCGTYRWQYCLAGCVWSGACSSCDPVIGCPDCG